MANEAVKFGATTPFDTKPAEKKIYGASIATVLNNIDCTGEARVQLQIPWLPGYTPWARLSSQMAGMSSGSFFVPQIGDEVLIEFHNGDVREPYVIGACWNTQDRPPATAPTDATSKRKIRTPLGHELSFDELTQTVTLESNLGSTVTLGPTSAQISTKGAKITIGVAGDITISAKTKLTLEAQVVEINAKSVLTAQSKGAAQFKAEGACSLEGKMVKIN